MSKVYDITSTPTRSAIYAMYGGKDRKHFVVYVGVTENLRTRLRQHLVQRISSVTSDNAAVNLNPDYITRVDWWVHASLRSKLKREAAELIAANILRPVLVSRNPVSNNARSLSVEPTFHDQMTELFQGNPSGSLRILALEDALARIDALEVRITELEKLLLAPN